MRTPGPSPFAARGVTARELPLEQLEPGLEEAVRVAAGAARSLRPAGSIAPAPAWTP